MLKKPKKKGKFQSLTVRKNRLKLWSKDTDKEHGYDTTQM